MLINIRKSIVVQTRKGNDINNEQFFDVDDYYKNQCLYYDREYSEVVRRTDISPIYNCHGMTFASRRTWIYEIEEINKIIEDDNYKEITINEILPGDIVFYIDEETKDITHSGIVISKYEISDRGIINMPQIISKWGGCREVVHKIDECPYRKNAFIKFYRIMK